MCEFSRKVEKLCIYSNRSPCHSFVFAKLIVKRNISTLSQQSTLHRNYSMCIPCIFFVYFVCILCCRLPAVYQSSTSRLPAVYQPSTNRLPAVYQPHTSHVPVKCHQALQITMQTAPHQPAKSPSTVNCDTK